MNTLFARFRKKIAAMSIYSWLSSREALRPNAVEEIFCKPFAELPCQITDHVGRSMYRAMFCDVREIEENLTFFQRWQLKQIKARIEDYLSITVDDRSVVYITLVSDRIAVAVMYLTYIQYWAKTNGVHRVTLRMLKEKVFPNGHPNEGTLKQIWYKQKVSHDTGSDNLLDHAKAMLSINYR